MAIGTWKALDMATVLAFINYKGGVAKTTSAYHIGCWLAGPREKRVLLIDIDPQTNLTFLCASVEDWQKRKKRPGTIPHMYKRYVDRKPIDAKRYIWREPIRLRDKRRHPRVHLVPCDIDLIGEDIATGGIVGVHPSMAKLKEQAENVLRDRQFLCRVVEEVSSDYDYIIIDCPPNLYLMTQNALLASDYYIVTAIPDHLSTIGLNTLQRKVGEMDKMLKSAATLAGRPSIEYAELGGILFVRVRIGGQVMTNAHADKMAEVRATFGDKCFDTHTTELIGYAEAAANSLPVWLHDSDNARRASGKQEYPKVADQLLRRFRT